MFNFRGEKNQASLDTCLTGFVLYCTQKCTEYWPEEQVTYEGIEITVNRVIQADDYRLRLITLKVNHSNVLTVV